MEMVHFIPPGQRKLARMAAQTDSAPALISGASGTGKGAIARWIHNNGPRASGAFVEARNDRPFSTQAALAQAGTLVIHEIGEWPLAEQMSILGFLKARAVQHPGNSTPTGVPDPRIIATTSQALDGRAQGGLFNRELLEKLNVFRIEMPPLCKRADEFDEIALGILEEITRELRKGLSRGIAPEACQALKSYDWPGNLRELRNVLRIAVIAANGDRVESAHLPNFGSDRIDFRATREQFEKGYLLELLNSFDWDLDKTCQAGLMSRDSLLSKMKQYRITSRSEG